MLKHILFFAFVCLSLTAYSQDPVSWKGEIVKDGSDTYINIKGEIDKGWYVYSQDTNPDGPIPTEVILINEDNFETEGDLIEQGEMIKLYDELFEVDVMKYKDEIGYMQKLRRVKNGATIKCEVTYMTCDDKRCLPPVTVELEILN